MLRVVADVDDEAIEFFEAQVVQDRGEFLRRLVAEQPQALELVAEEESLLESSRGTDGLSEADDARLKAVEVALDQCWDLLRQRRARREAGENPDAASMRPPDEVEGYRQ